MSATEVSRLRSSRIKKDEVVAPNAIINIMTKTRRVSFSLFSPEKISKKSSVIKKQMLFEKQHNNPITNAGETG